ncbi:PfkB family carbohydrate kinase [Arthrobacter mobilis]|uniref:Phosphofructokinase n=1 Tax=Arthrobacter mobilis TaxID=2724944 RepID=A0A7X6HG60_9MICC|nr:PfkB family carbohydrate kinase [Arthrobacter mobilis]NKX55770.1 phosphofructokinase [Arthrobacter mobilis]
MGTVVIFAPSPVLTVTVEDIDGTADIHVHAGGQGVWQARMLLALGTSVTMCGVFSGETGRVARHLISDEGVRVLSVEGQGNSGAYIHDRRGGERRVVAESPGDQLTRHELDQLYGLTLQAGMDAGTVILSGAVREDAVPVDVYRRLAADLGTAGCTVVTDLAGERLAAALAGGLAVVKIADNELVDSGRAAGPEPHQLVEAMRTLADEGARSVIVTRAHHPSLLLDEGEVSEVHMPELQSVDPHGAGDSLTAGVAAVLADGGSLHEAVVLGTAAGAQNVTRHGLGSGEAEAIRRLAGLVRIVPLEAGEAEPAQQLSPDELARKIREQ